MIATATAALHAAMADDWKAASGALQTLSDECGGAGVGDAMRAWCDTLIGRTHGDLQDSGSGVRLVFKNADSGEMGGADDVPAPTRWAGRLIAARAAMDQPTWQALLEAIPPGNDAVSEYVGALLQTIVVNLKAVA